MTVEYINGYRNPEFVITDKNNNFIERIALHLCDKDGLTEENIYERNIYKIIDRNIDVDNIGFHTQYTLSYASKSLSTNSMLIDTLHKYCMRTDLYDITIIPRSDIQDRSRKVAFINDNLKVGIKRGGVKARGNKGIVLVFQTVELQKDLNWIDPNNIRYIGYAISQINGFLET